MKIIWAKKIFLLILFLCYSTAHPTIVGSDSAPSRQTFVTFQYEDSDNEMNGFAAFENGFALETPYTTCTFDSFFPISGQVDMDCGTLVLEKDLIFDSQANLYNFGSIYGNGHSIEFSESVTTLTVFGIYSLLTHIDSDDLMAQLNSVDWSYDDANVFAVTNDQFLYCYEFTGTALVYRDYVNVFDVGCTRVPLTMKAHPSQSYLAIGTQTYSGQDEVRIYMISDSTFTLTDSVRIGTNVRCAGWSHDGSYLGIGYGSTVAVYAFEDGVLTHKVNLPYGSDSSLRRELAWDQTNSYFTIGTTDYVRIFHFDAGGNSLSSKATAPVINQVRGVDWSSTGSLIAVGTNEVRDQLWVYEYDSSLDTLTKKTDFDVGNYVYSVHWSNDVTKILLGTGLRGDGKEVQVYAYDHDAQALSLDAEEEVSATMNCVRWSHDNNYVVHGGTSQDLVVLSYTEGKGAAFSPNSILDNVSLFFNNDLLWKMVATIQGACTINARGNVITLQDFGAITVASGAQLTIENAELQGVTGESLACADDTASIVLRNCTIRLDDDFSFDTGFLLFEQDVIFTGTNKFIYAGSQTSTIDSNSTLMFDHDTTLKYEPSIADRDLLAMTDQASFLYLNGCVLHSTSTGLRLTGGTVFFDNSVTLSCEGAEVSESICLGNGVGADDVMVKILSDARVGVVGAFRYENVN